MGDRTEVATIDEHAAWSLLLALGAAPGASASVPLESGGDASLAVVTDGSWEASGSVSDAARALFDIFTPLAAADELVIGQLGQSLDGRIATEAGASHFVTGPQDIERLHRVRALVDAVVVGTNTVAADDPQLTVRRVPGENPVRVVLDPEARLDANLGVFTDEAAPTRLVRRAHSGSTEAEWQGDELLLPGAAGELDLGVLLGALRARGLKRILVEGGGVTVSRFLQAGLLDRLHVTVAPLLIGSGRPAITLSPIQSLDEAIRPRFSRFLLGRDVLYDLDLRRPQK